MPSPNTLDALADIAEDQWGLFTRQQAESTGMAWSTLARLASSGAAERVRHGVYRLRGAPPVDQIDLRAAWLQLDPTTPAWERGPQSGLVSHRSAAALYGLGHLPADVHEFTFPTRRQTGQKDVRIHKSHVPPADWIRLRGLPVTRPSRIASDLLFDREDPEAVAHVVADALRGVCDYPSTTADALNVHAKRFGLRSADGLSLLEWLLSLADASEREEWLGEARAHSPEKSPRSLGGEEI